MNGFSFPSEKCPLYLMAHYSVYLMADYSVWCIALEYQWSTPYRYDGSTEDSKDLKKTKSPFYDRPRAFDDRGEKGHHRARGRSTSKHSTHSKRI